MTFFGKDKKTQQVGFNLGHWNFSIFFFSPIGSYGSRVHQQSTPNHRSHSSYSYQHSRTTTGGSPSGTYREHTVPITETGMSSRASERKASGCYFLIQIGILKSNLFARIG